MTRSLWLLLGLTSTGFGIAGTVLPLVPTTPFLLLAAFAFARSSPGLHRWLVDHRQLGRLIRDWQKHRSIDRRVKVTALAVMAAMLVLTWLSGAALWILAGQAIVLGGVAAFVLTRPDTPAIPGRKPSAASSSHASDP
ncbi:MAG: DUF454 family protein [Hyphomicrobiaceae bacterium]|nr:DUF454 family protein [Hyphomicrobiaceae bacterium]